MKSNPSQIPCRCDCMWCKKGNCKVCNWGCKLVSRAANTSQNNYLQVGEITACGHCNPKKYGEGLSDALSANPDFKCECVCHDTNNLTRDVSANPTMPKNDALYIETLESRIDALEEWRDKVKDQLL